MTVSLMVRADEPKLELIYSWLEQHKGSNIQLFGWDANQRAALLAYGDGSDDPFGWANWITKVADDPSTLLPAFEQLELLTDEEAASVLNATFVGAFSVGSPGPLSGR